MTGKHPPKNRALYIWGHSLNKIAKDLFEKDIEFRDYVTTTAKAQIKRRQNDYSAMAIFDAEDLEQEIWENLFESECAGRESLEKRVIDFVEGFARKGERKRGGFAEIPVSQLPDGQRQAVENLFYSSDYEESE